MIKLSRISLTLLWLLLSCRSFSASPEDKTYLVDVKINGKPLIYNISNDFLQIIKLPISCTIYIPICPSFLVVNNGKRGLTYTGYRAFDWDKKLRSVSGERFKPHFFHLRELAGRKTHNLLEFAKWITSYDDQKNHLALAKYDKTELEETVNTFTDNISKIKRELEPFQKTDIETLPSEAIEIFIEQKVKLQESLTGQIEEKELLEKNLRNIEHEIKETEKEIKNIEKYF